MKVRTFRYTVRTISKYLPSALFFLASLSRTLYAHAVRLYIPYVQGVFSTGPQVSGSITCRRCDLYVYQTAWKTSTGLYKQLH